MMSAIVKNGVVVNVAMGAVNGGIECPASVRRGWLYDGETFTPPQPPAQQPLGELKLRALESIKAQHARLLNELTGYETTEERDTWRSQLAWASSYKAGDESSKVHLVDLLRQEEIDFLGEGGALLELCDKILAKATHVEDIIGRVGGLRRVARYEIEAAETLDQVKDAIKKFEEEGAKL